MSPKSDSVNITTVLAKAFGEVAKAVRLYQLYSARTGQGRASALEQIRRWVIGDVDISIVFLRLRRRLVQRQAHGGLKWCAV